MVSSFVLFQFCLLISASNLNPAAPLAISFTSKAKDLVKLRGGAGGGESVDWRYFLAGGICAATSHGITTPIGKSSIPCLLQVNATSL